MIVPVSMPSLAVYVIDIYIYIIEEDLRGLCRFPLLGF